MTSLYLVATPIGNLEDISLRALRVLREVDLIAAEDTRKTRYLLSANGIKTPLTSYHEHNKISKLPYLLRRLKEVDIALVSEAGTPGISDPGYELVVAALEERTPVVPIPGPSVVVTALTVSGLPTDSFLYVGFLPRRQGDRRRRIQSLADQTATLVAFEAPHRLRATLTDLLEVLGDRRVALCRELTKLYEEVFRGRISQALEHFAQPRGEFTLVIEGSARMPTHEFREGLEEELRLLKDEGVLAREAVARAAKARGLPKKKVYEAWLKLH